VETSTPERRQSWRQRTTSPLPPLSRDCLRYLDFSGDRSATAVNDYQSSIAKELEPALAMIRNDALDDLGADHCWVARGIRSVIDFTRSTAIVRIDAPRDAVASFRACSQGREAVGIRNLDGGAYDHLQARSAPDSKTESWDLGHSGSWHPVHPRADSRDGLFNWWVQARNEGVCVDWIIR